MYNIADKYPEPFENKGWCNCCDKQTKFMASNNWYRDSYVCQHCNCIPRERAIMYVIEMLYPSWKQLRIHESSPANRGASAKLKKALGYLPFLL